ncbi:hypothetical protein IMCC9480_2945 [Oxalobacteraceae bacterium IMCC9480]|nr:hypothetical protein IMCC9480_2945 [Oxalobacteraceae bacterium IMCC9480]
MAHAGSIRQGEGWAQRAGPCMLYAREVRSDAGVTGHHDRICPVHNYHRSSPNSHAA